MLINTTIDTLHIVSISYKEKLMQYCLENSNDSINPDSMEIVVNDKLFIDKLFVEELVSEISFKVKQKPSINETALIEYKKSIELKRQLLYVISIFDTKFYFKTKGKISKLSKPLFFILDNEEWYIKYSYFEESYGLKEFGCSWCYGERLSEYRLYDAGKELVKQSLHGLK